MAGTGGEEIGLGLGEAAPLGRSTRGTEDVEETNIGSEIMPRVTDLLRSLRVAAGRLLRSSAGTGWEAKTGDDLAEFEVEFGLAYGAEGGALGAWNEDTGEGWKGGLGDGRGGPPPGGRFI